ncbi:MAG: DUF3883 domain-containing protein [Planctomycetota bacterium]
MKEVNNSEMNDVLRPEYDFSKLKGGVRGKYASRLQQKMKILLCNVCWMKHYAGVNQDDIPKHGGRYVRQHGYGHEAINFRAQGGFLYGFVQLRTGTINIKRLDPSADNKTEDVLVVWRARSNEGSVIVGWYKHATVYGKLQEPVPGRSFTYNGETIRPEWIVTAKESDCFLVPPLQRVFKVPVTHKGFGSQTFVSFLETDTGEVKEFKEQLLDYISRAERGIFVVHRKGKKAQVYQIKKVKIKKAAIDASSDYYVNRGYDVKSVEKENAGYDLIASSEHREILIEVKGTSLPSGKVITVNLSPNEYRKSKSQKNKYRICIVTDCLNNPNVHEFVWNNSEQQWENENGGNFLDVAEKVSADFTITK